MAHVPGQLCHPSPACVYTHSRLLFCSVFDTRLRIWFRPVEPCQESVHVRRRSGVALLADACGHRATRARLLLERRRQQTPQTREVLSPPSDAWLEIHSGGASHREDSWESTNRQYNMEIICRFYLYFYLFIFVHLVKVCCCAACSIFRSHSLERIMPGPSRMRQSTEFLSWLPKRFFTWHHIQLCKGANM